MPKKNLPYVNAYKDRTGKMRYYLRRPGCRQIALDGAPGSREFMKSYAAVTAAPVIPKKVRPQPRIGHVYYLSDADRIKIGFTIDWSRRQKQYRTHRAGGLTLLALELGYQSDETKLHRKFKRYRIGDTDWFHPGPELLEHIDDLTVPNEIP
jgi:hypothetical protein